MIYEVYFDSLFLELFLWNYCLLVFINWSFWHSQGSRRLLAGAFLGAGGYVGTMLLPVNLWTKGGLAIAGCLLMLGFTFPVKHFRGFLRVLEHFLKYAILTGGSILVILQVPPFVENGVGLPLLLCLLGILTSLAALKHKHSLQEGSSEGGEAVLVSGGRRIRVGFIVDSGNSLVEPISKKPVCVLSPRVGAELWSSEDPFRVIPYRSVGKEKGILRGYLLSELRLEMQGPVKRLRNVYVAISPQELAGEDEKIQMIIHPGLLAQWQKTGYGKKKKEGIL